MLEGALSNSRIVAGYRQKTPESERLADQAQGLFPSGITHDSRYLEPYGIYVTRAAGSRKCADGNEYVDYFGGHGALILGHNHPTVLAAVHRALDDGTHFGANHLLELQWAEIVQRLVPSAERVRFTSSGTEATLMAVRLARAHTGKSKLVRFKTHFHGWHDHMTFGYGNHFDGTATVGVLPGIAENVVLLAPGDIDAVREVLAADDDIAALILEPTGATFGMVPVTPAYLADLREITAAHGVVLIFDEVVTGFRVSRGGAQGELGIKPDLTALAKILSGGLPGGAVAGAKDILDHLDFARAKERGIEKIQHPGTYNANPVSAAAGIAALGELETTDANDRANATAAAIRDGLNQLFEAEEVPWAAYGTYSGFHVFLNPKQRRIVPSEFDPLAIHYDELKQNPPVLAQKLRIAMLVAGVDITGWPGGMVSAVHDERDVAATIAAFGESIHMLKREGEL